MFVSGGGGGGIISVYLYNQKIKVILKGHKENIII